MHQFDSDYGLIKFQLMQLSFGIGDTVYANVGGQEMKILDVSGNTYICQVIVDGKTEKVNFEKGTVHKKIRK